MDGLGPNGRSAIDCAVILRDNPAMTNPSHAFLRHLGAVLSLPGLRFNDDSVCCLAAPGEVELQMEWVAQAARLILLSPLGTLSGEAEQTRMLLSANFLFAGTRGETLSVDPESDRIFLCAGIDLAEVSVDHAIVIVERFIDTARQWRKALAENATPVLPAHLTASLRV
ncbi:MAG: Tir chaperone protein (CesT) family [Pseudomonadota bacterium]|jgi:hypothetical protein